MVGVDKNYERSILSLLGGGVWLGIMLMLPSFDAYPHKNFYAGNGLGKLSWKCIVNSIT